MFNDALNVIFPKVVRVAFYVSSVLMLIITGIVITLMLSSTDFKAEWRLMTEQTAISSDRALDIETRKGSKGSITYLYRFECTPAGWESTSSTPLRGICFSGAQIASTGESVRVEYIPDSPETSRIQGCCLSFVSVEAILILPIVVLIAAILPIGTLRYKKKWLERLLTFGITTSAVIENVKPGPKGSLIVALRYAVDGVEIKSKANTSGRKHEKEWLTYLHESGIQVTGLVNPSAPKSLFLLDLLLCPSPGK